MQVKSISECSRSHSSILLTFIKLPFVIKVCVLSIFEPPFYTGFTVYAFWYRNKKKKASKIFSPNSFGPAVGAQIFIVLDMAQMTYWIQGWGLSWGEEILCEKNTSFLNSLWSKSHFHCMYVLLHMVSSKKFCLTIISYHEFRQRAFPSSKSVFKITSFIAYCFSFLNPLLHRLFLDHDIMFYF